MELEKLQESEEKDISDHENLEDIIDDELNDVDKTLF